MTNPENKEVLDIAIALAEQFSGFRDEVRDRFDKIDAKFVQIDAKFEQIDAKFDQIDARFDQIDAKYVQIDARLEKIDIRLESLEEESKAHGAALDTILEGDTLGKGNITLTRDEYDVLVHNAGITNRFKTRTG